MLTTFQAYPELLCVDATYKLLQLGFPTYIFLCEDSNGLSEAVAVCLLTMEDTDCIKWMVETFKKFYSSWSKVRVVMADKDIQERDVIKQCLPNASIVICLFHTLRTFRREVTCEKLGITSGQRTLCLELLQKMAHAYSESQYDSLYSRFQKDVPKEVLKYFNSNWHCIRKEWVLGMKFVGGSFLNSTNNRLEALNGKLKQVITRNSSLEEFVDSFFTILTSLRTERDHKAALLLQRVRIFPFQEGSPEYRYSRLLTSYAFKFVMKQLELMDKVKEMKNLAGSEEFVVDTSEGQCVIGLMKCSCVFFTAMSLPCRHVFALRKSLNKPLFDSELCDNRWRMAYYRETH